MITIGCDEITFSVFSFLCLYSLIPEPKYTIIREPVEGNVPEFLVFEVQLPKVVRKCRHSLL